MKIVIPSLILFLGIVTSAFGQINLEIRISPKSKIIQCEPVGIRVTWTNVGSQPLEIGPNLKPTQNAAVSIWVDGQETLRMPAPNETTGDFSLLAKRTILPGESIKGGVSYLDLNLSVGKHTLKVVADLDSLRNPNLKGKVESNSANLTLEFPEGEDLHAWQNAQKFVLKETSSVESEKEQILRVCGKLSDYSFVKSYPTSTYLAYAFLDKYPIFRSNLKPQAFVDRARVPGFVRGRFKENLLPDGSASSAYVWQTAEEWLQEVVDIGEILLKKHDNDPYLGVTLRMNIGLSNYILGRRDSAKRILQEALRKNSAPTESERVSQLLFYMEQKP
ncbi:tetratricopeptide repeat protein [bacterium]|nr:tetratricopeptide repeat protein [bacterium]